MNPENLTGSSLSTDVTETTQHNYIDIGRNIIDVK